MGYSSALDMVEHLDLDRAIAWHLESNHYPPVPSSMVPMCIAALDAVLAEEPDRRIDLPEGIAFRGEPSAPAWAVVEGHHLDAFLDALDWTDLD
jgi:hypothetical protein